MQPNKNSTVLLSCFQTLDPEQAWNFWDNAPDVEHCSWTIKHEDKNEQYLEFSIFVKQGKKSTFLPILEFFEASLIWQLSKMHVEYFIQILKDLCMAVVEYM